MLAARSRVDQVFDSVAIRIDGPRAWDEHLLLAWTSPTRARPTSPSCATARSTTARWRRPRGRHHLHLTRLALIGLVTGPLDLAAALGDGTVAVDGDPPVLGRLVGVARPRRPDFAIVTP